MPSESPVFGCCHGPGGVLYDYHQCSSQVWKPSSGRGMVPGGSWMGMDKAKKVKNATASVAVAADHLDMIYVPV